jgi:hypothetical protein
MKIAQTWSLHHDIVKKLITEELNLQWVNINWIPYTFTTNPKLEGIKTSRKLFGQLNKPQVNDLARAVMGDETWVYFENLRSTIWVDTDVRRPIQLKWPIDVNGSCFGCASPHRNC